MWLKGQYHRITWLPRPASQGYITTTTTIKVEDLGKHHIHHHKRTWVPWPTLQSYVYYNEVTSHRKTMNSSAWLYIIDLCGCHHHHSRVIWWALSLRCVETMTYFAELQDCQDQHCHSYVNITTTTHRYVNTITSNITKWSNYLNQSGKVVSITLRCVMTLTTTTAVMETSLPTPADVWIWLDHCRSASYFAHHHRAIEDHFITLQNHMIPSTPP